MELAWVQQRTVARRCPLCRHEGQHPVVIQYRAPYRDNPLRDLLRCQGCRSLFLDDLSPPPHIEDSPGVRHHINFYVELAAGVDVMVELLYKLDTAGVRSYLEIGCGFGFGLDFVRRVFGWQVAGIDPGIIAQAGKRTLGLDIVGDYVVPGYDFGGRRFDVMLCSEVLEHVPAPNPFLETLKVGLTENGVLLLTTPNADQLRPDTPASTLLPILQPGFHLVLFTRESLAHALRDAGFAYVQVWEQGASLWATAANRPITVRLDAHTDPEHYRRYLENSLKGRAPSPLAVGMAFRLFKLVTNAGDFAAAEPAFARARAVIRSVYGIDVNDPEALGLATLPPLRFYEVGTHMPFCLGCLLYYRGIGMLITGRYPEAAAFFRAGAAAALGIRRALRELAFDDGDTESAWQLSRVHLPMALAHVDAVQALQALADLVAPAPESVPAGLWSLPSALLARARLETFSRLVSVGCYHAAETIMAAVREDLGVKASDLGETTVAAARSMSMLSALYSLAILTANHLANPRAAASLFAATRDACRMRLAEAPHDPQATDLGGQAQIAETACRAAAGPDATRELEAPEGALTRHARR